MGDYDNIIRTAAEDAHARGLAEGLAKGLAEGEAKGREEGREEGKQTKAMEIARNLKAAGMQVSDIAIATGLTEEQVAAL